MIGSYGTSSEQVGVADLSCPMTEASASHGGGKWYKIEQWTVRIITHSISKVTQSTLSVHLFPF